MVSSDDILRDFIHLGKSEEEVEVLGFKIRYRTLTADEQTAVFDHCARYEDFARVSVLRRETLIYAIETINGAPLEDLYLGEDKDKISDIEKRRKILGKIDTEVLSVIFSEHSEMSEKRNQVLEKLGKKEDQQMEEGLKNLPSESPAD